MTVLQSILIIAAVVAGTMVTRFLPFLIFSNGKKPSAFVNYLGTVLPYSVIGLLVVYCLKDAGNTSLHGLPEMAAVVVTVVLHKWKKNTLLSIAAGTVFYMFFVQRCFV